jgi:hypothetical protein
MDHLEVHEGAECQFQKKTMIKFMQVRDGETRKVEKATLPKSEEIDEIKELAIAPATLSKENVTEAQLCQRTNISSLQRKESLTLCDIRIVCNFTQ